jgi:hypothetical protein
VSTTGRSPIQNRTLVLRLRPSRRKARELAVAEVVALLREFEASAAPGGPLSELGGVCWVTVQENYLEGAIGALALLGYTAAVDLVSQRGADNAGRNPRSARRARKPALLPRVYEEPDESVRASAPDRRTFLLECADGLVRAIQGYRGSRGPLAHRALPVEDARLLVNLVAAPDTRLLLDPFAGAGGVIIAAKARGFTTVSLDLDPALRFGLAQFSDWHIVGDASSLPLASASIDMAASEPPYDASALGVLLASIHEIARVLRPGGRAAFLLASEQAAEVRQAGTDTGLVLEIESPVNRKGVSATCQCWSRPSVAPQPR